MAESEEPKRKRTRSKKKYIQRSNAICMVAHSQNGDPIPPDHVEYVETVVNNATAQLGLLVNITRS